MTQMLCAVLVISSFHTHFDGAFLWMGSEDSSTQLHQISTNICSTPSTIANTSMSAHVAPWPCLAVTSASHLGRGLMSSRHWHQQQDMMAS